MIKKDNHLKKIRDFNLVVKKGSWVNSDFLSLKMLDLAKNENLIPKKED
jgi:RNase P protein component